MYAKILRSNILLLLTALIWGFAFVAQRASMVYVGPFTFNAFRFALGGLSLVPLVFVIERQRQSDALLPVPSGARSVFPTAGLVGLVLFLGATFQQVGVASTTAGKAGFITGLYVIFVPLLGLLWKQRTASRTWGGAILAVVGLYLLSVTEDFTIAPGDLLVLIGAFFWAGHVHLIARFSARIGPVKLACLQFFVCSMLSFIAAFLTETISWQGISGAMWPILYGGFMSVGIAYTLQVVGQRDAHPAHAAIILSLESVFALIGGMLILQETFSVRGMVGCSLMLAGMLFSQLSGTERRPAISEAEASPL